MPLVLDGTNGVSGVDGTASNPAIEGTDSNTGIFYPAADTVAIGTGGTEALRVNSSQNVGIGTSSPSSRLHVTSGGGIRVDGNGASGYNTTVFVNDSSVSLSVGVGGSTAAGWSNNSAVIGTTSNTPLLFGTSNAERMRLDASGNFMVGGTTARGMLTIGGNSGRHFAVGDTGIATLRFDDNGTPAFNFLNYGITGANQGYQLRWQLADAAANFAVAGSIAVQTDQAWTSASSTQDAYMQFAVALNGTNTERARITSGGEVLFGATSNIFSRERVHIYKNGGEGLTIQNDNNNYSSIFVKGINSGTCTVMLIRNSADTTVGSITHNGTNTTYGTTSDYRLKHGMQPMTGALAKVQALKPVTYKWNADNSDGEGFIAHELQEVCPDAVVGEKDAVDEEGKPVYQAIDTSFLVATLTAAIQEQQAMIDELKAKVAALENA